MFIVVLGNSAHVASTEHRFHSHSCEKHSIVPLFEMHINIALENKTVKKKHKKRKEKRHREEFKQILKVSKLAAAGKAEKLSKLLHKYPNLDLNTFDLEGLTALHKAARHGHIEAVELLLSKGADAKAEDFGGNTPAHLAAARGHFNILAELLKLLDIYFHDLARFLLQAKAQSAPRLDAPNADDTTIRQLLQNAIECQQLQQKTANTFLSQRDVDTEHEWLEKLRDNSDLGGFEATCQEWESFDVQDTGPGCEDTLEDEEDYARRIWEEMRRRQAGRQQASAAATDAWRQADKAERTRRKPAEQAAEQAAAHSRKILEEEEARDRAWRQAVLQGDMGARRASYEAKWHIFASSNELIDATSVPWLVKDKEDARSIILYGTSTVSEQKRRILQELMRWHPDKFEAKFGSRIIAADRVEILQGVKVVSQMLNSLDVFSQA